jgi:hypothetical protein
MEEIKKTTLSVISEMEQFVSLRNKGRTFNIPEEQYKKILSAIEYKDENITKIDSLIAAK